MGLLAWIGFGALLLAQVRVFEANPFRAATATDGHGVIVAQPAPPRALDPNPWGLVAHAASVEGPSLGLDRANPFSGAVAKPSAADAHPRAVDAANPFQR